MCRMQILRSVIEPVSKGYFYLIASTIFSQPMKHTANTLNVRDLMYICPCTMDIRVKIIKIINNSIPNAFAQLFYLAHIISMPTSA